MNSSRLVVLGMFAVALAMGAYAWFHHLRESQRIVDVLGDQAQLIRHAPTSTLLLPDSIQADVEAGKDGDPKIDSPNVVSQWRRIDLSQMPGLVHARHALIVDFNFDWEARIGEEIPQWDFGLEFSQQNRQATLLFDFSRQVVWVVERDCELRMKPELTTAFRKKLTDWSSKRQ